MRAGGGAVAQQLLGDDVAVEEAPLAAAVLLGPGDADPALLAQRLAELRRERVPAREAVLGLEARQRLLEEGADLTAQRLGLVRQMERREFELGDGHRHLGCWMPLLCRLILDRATREFRGTNAPPCDPPTAAPGGIRRRGARGRALSQPRLLPSFQRARRRGDGPDLGADRRGGLPASRPGAAARPGRD